MVHGAGRGCLSEVPGHCVGVQDGSPQWCDGTDVTLQSLDCCVCHCLRGPVVLDTHSEAEIDYMPDLEVFVIVIVNTQTQNQDIVMKGPGLNSEGHDAVTFARLQLPQVH